MSNPLSELGTFFSDEDVVEELRAEDSEVLDAYEKAIGNDADLEARVLCAYISNGSGCGFANSGRLAYVQNRRRDRSVRATVKVRWSQGIDNGTYQRTKTIPAGGRVSLGCTRGPGVSGASYSFSVIGCEIL